MPTTPSDPSKRLDQIEAILMQVATQQQINTQVLGQVTQRLDRMAEHQQNKDSNLNDLNNKFNDFIGTANTVLGRSAVLDDIILGMDARTTALETIVVMMDQKNTALENIVVRLDRNFEELSRNFGENQRSTNAALERLEAILLKLIDGNNTH